MFFRKKTTERNRGQDCRPCSPAPARRDGLWCHGGSPGPGPIPPPSSPHPSPTRYLTGPDLILQTGLLPSLRDCWGQPSPEPRGGWGRWRDGKGLGAEEPRSPQRGTPGSRWARTPEMERFLQRWRYAERSRGKDLGSAPSGGPSEGLPTAGRSWAPHRPGGTRRLRAGDFGQQALQNLLVVSSPLTI